MRLLLNCPTRCYLFQFKLRVVRDFGRVGVYVAHTEVGLVLRSFASLRWYEKRACLQGYSRARSTDPEAGTHMIHVGADLHERFCYMTALDATGRKLKAGAVVNRALELRR